MNGSSTFEGLTQRALDDHRQIHFYLDQITNTLQTLTKDMPDVEPMRRLAAQLAGLEERLIEHHHLEEHQGLFDAILDVIPACRVEIERLANQHGRMIEILEMARLHAQGGDVATAESLREDLSKFVEVFRRHERDEERLLSQAIELESSAAD